MTEKRIGAGKPGPGRPKGAPNKVSADVKALAQQHGPAAIKKLAEIMKDDKHPGQVQACKEILDRAYGKPTQDHTTDLKGDFRISWISGG